MNDIRPCNVQGWTSLICVMRGSTARRRVGVFVWLDPILSDGREPDGEVSRAGAIRFRMESPIASAAASIRSVCFLTSCRRTAKLSISPRSSSVPICEFPFPSANFNRVALFLASSTVFFRDIMVAPFVNCYLRTLSGSVSTDKRQRAPLGKCVENCTCGYARLFRRLTIKLARQYASHRTFSLSQVRTVGLLLAERRCGHSG